MDEVAGGPDKRPGLRGRDAERALLDGLGLTRLSSIKGVCPIDWTMSP
jgi:hypothetical protein